MAAEGMLGGTPAADQCIGKDDPLEWVDGEKTGIQVWREVAAVLADPGDERAAGREVHLHHVALGRRRDPPLFEARAVGPGIPHGAPRRLDDPRDRQVELWMRRPDHRDFPSLWALVANCSSRSVRASQSAR